MVKSGACGHDNIHLLSLKRLPEVARYRLLEIYNRSWTEARFPSDWRMAQSIRIRKSSSKSGFTAQTDKVVKKMKSRPKIISALSGKSWGLSASDLRTLYKCYVRPGGLFAAGFWYPFLSGTSCSKLEVANNSAARIIAGLPSGSPSVPVCTEAGFPSIKFVAEVESALHFKKIASLPEEHHLHDITTTRSFRPRLKSRGESSLRDCWRSRSNFVISITPNGRHL